MSKLVNQAKFLIKELIALLPLLKDEDEDRDPELQQLLNKLKETP